MWPSSGYVKGSGRFAPQDQGMQRHLLSGLVPAVLLAACADSSRGPSGLLITLDTTNPGALSCYSGPEGWTPHLDRLAAEGILFEEARTVAPITLPAHASMLTGLTPLRHTVRRNGAMVVPESAVTLAELAAGAGMRTAAFVAAVVLDGEFGLDQGFEVYRDPETPERVEEHLEVSRTAKEIVDDAIGWLSQLEGSEEFFLWVHFYDPHYPYRPPGDWLRRANGDAYLGEVGAMDAELGRLFSFLEEAGRWDDTLICAVADHGEGLGRHGEDTHGYFVYDSTLRVPLILRLPGSARAGERVGSPVSVVDVHPTFANALGLGAHESGLPLDGVDLLAPSLAPDRGVYFESYFGVVAFHWSQLAGWADAEGKFVHSSAPELYALPEDVGETSNLFAERPDDVAAYRARVQELSARERLAVARLDEDYLGLLGQIERLGYAGADTDETGTPEPLEPSALPSPHRRVQAYADYTRARQLMEEDKDFAEAAVLLARVVRGNKANHKAQFHLGMCLKALERYGEAIPPFRAVLQSPGGERIPAELNLAVCYYNVGQKGLAIDHLKSALDETIGPPGAMELLIQLLDEAGRAAEAARYRARLGQRGAG